MLSFFLIKEHFYATEHKRMMQVCLFYMEMLYFCIVL